MVISALMLPPALISVAKVTQLIVGVVRISVRILGNPVMVEIAVMNQGVPMAVMNAHNLRVQLVNNITRTIQVMAVVLWNCLPVIYLWREPLMPMVYGVIDRVALVVASISKSIPFLVQRQGPSRLMAPTSAIIVRQIVSTPPVQEDASAFMHKIQQLMKGSIVPPVVAGMSRVRVLYLSKILILTLAN